MKKEEVRKIIEKTLNKKKKEISNFKWYVYYLTFYFGLFVGRIQGMIKKFINEKM